MENIDLLLTTVSKTEEELLTLVHYNKLFGHVLIGNQMADDNSYRIVKSSDTVIEIFNLKDKGVSKNRNFLLNKSKADYVIFMDDDISISNETLSFSNFTTKAQAFRFNVVSTNKERPLKLLKKEKLIHFFDVKSFGVFGIVFDRKFLIENKLFFNENIGPGTDINHGEDTLFLKSFFKKGKMYQIKSVNFSVSHSDSTWQGSNRNISKELFGHGYVYRLLFEAMWFPLLAFSLRKHYSLYKDFGSFLKVLKQACNGAKQCKKDLNAK